MDSSSRELKYPIYIVSKGRADIPYTANFLKKENIDFKVAVEPQEYKEYCDSIGEKYILKLPFSNLGLGSYPARNYCFEHSKEIGAKKHFLFDDNIRGFYRLNEGKRTRSEAFIALKSLEEFSDRYSNLAISGYNYLYFVTKETKKPFSINTHVYSGMLINNSIKYRWRLKYNEDVDICLQALHDGLCTVLINVFLIDKISTTVKLKGGNQTELYKNNNDQKKALKSSSLKEVWPDYVKIVSRFGRPHHHISWNKYFKHPLIKNKDNLNG
jgi:hypothetical protein